MRNAASSEGEYFPSSMAFTVWRVTLIFSASSCCVISPCSKRRRRISLRMVAMSRAPAVLDDLATGAHDLARHQDQKQRICAKDNRSRERRKKDGECESGRQPRVSHARRPHFDQFFAFVHRRICVFRIENGDHYRQRSLYNYQRYDG